MKKLMTAMALVTLAATPTFAATKHPRAVQTYTAADAYAAAPFATSPVVIVGGKIVGADPDPNVRLQLLTQPSYNQ